MTIKSVSSCLAWFVLLISSVALAAPVSVDARNSKLTVRVYKSGFFSAFAHDHEIVAPIDHGTFDEQNRSVEISVDAGKLKVVDKESSEGERQKVQSKMLSPDVLDPGQFKEIRFHSTKVDVISEASWQVTGDLTLHGQTHPIAFRVTKSNGHFQGVAEVKQTDFGMTPVTIAGGSVKVKDRVRIEFDVVGP